jgi:hypothetical protein
MKQLMGEISEIYGLLITFLTFLLRLDMFWELSTFGGVFLPLSGHLRVVGPHPSSLGLAFEGHRKPPYLLTRVRW